MRVELGPEKKKSWIVAVLKKQLWSDAVNDCIICIAYSSFAFLFAIGFILGSLNFWLVLAALALGTLFVVAGVGLKRERHWAALLATGLFGLIGCWLVSLYFASRAQELRTL
jgi:hypothetical protein